MRKLLLTALLPVAASAGTLELDREFYWQVQNAVTYGVACEGYLDECVAPDGFYIVVNHSTGERSENVFISNPAVEPLAGGVIKAQAIQSNQLDMQCPAGMSAVSVTCAAQTIEDGYLATYSFVDGDIGTCHAPTYSDMIASTYCEHVQFNE